MGDAKPSGYQVCTRCVMDTTDPEITFDASGVCRYCRLYDSRVRPGILNVAEKRARLGEITEQIKTAGRNKKYDSVLGLSGGLDSSYLAYIAWKNGLRPLVIHLDNSWDSEIAVNNVENIVRETGFDYYNHVVDWEEFRDIQLSYLKASVLDVEVVSDHAILALMYRLAAKNGTRYILSGENYSLEGALSGRGWNYPYKQDLLNLKAIHREFGTMPMKTFPTKSLHGVSFCEEALGIRRVRLLDCVDYTRKEAMARLESEMGWRYYGDKHFESLFTKFYQAYILPRKFGLDKRRPHLCSMIHSGQMTRAEAMDVLSGPPYPEHELAAEYEYVIKKLGLSRQEFEEIMAKPPVPHDAYPQECVTQACVAFYSIIGVLNHLFAPAAQRRTAILRCRDACRTWRWKTLAGLKKREPAVEINEGAKQKS